jgi:uncharacterized repeat protein (TIGR01451 family)
MKRMMIYGGVAVVLGIMSWLLGDSPPVMDAQVTDDHDTYYVAPSCTGVPVPCFTTIQSAVDAADDPDDVIKVAAAVYEGVSARQGITQAVYISKTVTIRGGYGGGNWDTFDPGTSPTTLDAQGQGRGLYITGQATGPTIVGLRIANGNATGLGGGPWGGHDVGGGVYVISATLTLADSQVFSNTATHGGGIGAVNASVVVSDSRVFGNTAGGAGGGLYVINGYEDDDGDTDAVSITASLLGSQVFKNRAGGGGGGVYIENYSEPLEESLGTVMALLSENRVFGNSAGGAGGGLYLANSTATVVGNVVTTNTAAYDGGGLSVGRCLFCSSNSTPPKLGDNVFRANQAGQGGGGLYLGYQSAMLSNNIVISNSASQGGGVYAYFGGGTFTNTVITDNRADITGSGLSFVATWSRLLHTTIARNDGGDGSGICITPSQGSILVPNRVTLTNTVIASQTVGITMTGFSGGLWGDVVVLDGVLWFDNETNIVSVDPSTITQVSFITVTRAYTGDPAFSIDGYHLTADSVAIDRGVRTSVAVDVDGEPRPPMAGCDLGADEYPVALRVIKQASLDPVRPGTRLTYTIRVTNTGSVDLHGIITDSLPTHIVPGQTPGGTAIMPGGQITWTARITAPGGAWTDAVVVTVEEGYLGLMTNSVEVATGEGAAGRDDAIVRVGQYVYLPLVIRIH